MQQRRNYSGNIIAPNDSFQFSNGWKHLSCKIFLQSIMSSTISRSKQQNKIALRLVNHETSYTVCNLCVDESNIYWRYPASS